MLGNDTTIYQPNVIEEQLKCGLPDKVAGRVDTAANLSNDMPNDLAAFWAVG